MDGLKSGNFRKEYCFLNKTMDCSEVNGMNKISESGTTINDAAPHRIQFCQRSVKRKKKDGSEEQVKVFDPFKLKVGDTSMYDAYMGGGMITQHKKPFKMEFESLDTSLSHPISEGEHGLMFTDGAKFGRAEQLHKGLVAVLEFEQKNDRLPENNSDDIQQVLDLAKAGRPPKDGKTPFSVEELDEDVVRAIAAYASVELHPFSAFFGGVVAQEIVKFTGKFQPLKQWLHLDAFEVLPDKDNMPMDTKPIGSRYDNIISMFGLEFLEKLGNVQTFLVGCGALGCEYLKNFAMVGLACGDNGKVVVTDNDRIEVSNLNRQFLFRDHNVGQPKSVAATNAVVQMNSTLKVEALEHLVAPETEHIFNDEFWNKINVVTNALDNVKARLYVDGKCVYYKKPLLESGTLGTKCNVQVVVPHLTQSYADGPKDSADDSIPMCTLRNFPSLIEHCIEWARAQFEDVFVVPAADAKKFVSNPQSYLGEIRKVTIDHPNPKVGASAIVQELERLRSLKDIIQSATNITFEKCVDMAYVLFYSNFRDRILSLTHNFPEDHVTKAGEKFWSGAKRFPLAAEFDASNEQHMTFLIASANVFAVCFGLQPVPESSLVPLDSECRSLEFMTNIVSSIPKPEWQPSTEKIAEDDEALKKLEEEKRKAAEENGDSSPEYQEFIALLEELSALDASGLSFEPADFEKDQDLNFHIDFIYAASNLRASNYHIKNATRHKCKMIAGKIIPAIATTTASVTGLAMLEMIKIIQQKKFESYKDSSNSLGLNMYLMQEPAPPEKAKDEYDVIEMAEVKCKPSGFTKWQSTMINLPEATLGGFLEEFKKITELNCDLLFHGAAELGDENPKFQPISGLMLFDRNAFNPELKALYASKMDMLLRDWVLERYEGLVDCDTKYVELQTSSSDDEGNAWKVPTVVFHL